MLSFQGMALPHQAARPHGLQDQRVQARSGRDAVFQREEGRPLQAGGLPGDGALGYEARAGTEQEKK